MTDSTFDLTGIGGQASLFSRPRETSISGAVLRPLRLPGIGCAGEAYGITTSALLLATVSPRWLTDVMATTAKTGCLPE